jgi:hypothetical protein
MMTIDRRTSLLVALSVVYGILPLSACHTEKPAPALVLNTVPPSLTIPATVEHVAVLHPRSSDHDVLNAYAQLYGAVFQFKAQRPALKIVERFDLDRIMEEQRLQLNGMVSDDTAVHLGRVLGADAILLYHIDGPTTREKALARLEGEVSPYVLTSKLINVESGEVLYLNVVTTPVEKWNTETSFFAVDSYLVKALDRGVAQTIADLQRAFQ